MTGHESDFNKQAQFLRIKMHSIEPQNKKQNKGKRVIGELTWRWQDKHRQKNMPRRLWDFALVWCAEIFSHTYNAKTQRTGLERLTGDTPGISEWLDFDMYEQVWFWDSPAKEENPRPGRWLGVSHHIGSALCYWVIDGKGTIYSRTMVQHVMAQDMKSNDIRHQFESLDAALMEQLDDENFISTGLPDMPYEEDMEADYMDSPEPYDLSAVAGDIEEEANIYDKYLGAELYFDVGPNGAPGRGQLGST